MNNQFAEVIMYLCIRACRFSACALIIVAFSDPLIADTKSRPNIVIVLADDLGYGDLACYGHRVIKTPHLDRFAKQGLRLTDCYSAASNCSPARTGLMTGRTPYRVGIHNWIPMLSPMHVRKSEITVATLLKKAGYDTCHVGKWHLNGRFNLSGQPQPNDHGFNYWFSTQNNGLPTHHYPNNFVRNGKRVTTHRRFVGKDFRPKRHPANGNPAREYAGHLVVDEALHWLTGVRDKQKPFFLFVCFHEPHEPIASGAEYVNRYLSLRGGLPTVPRGGPKVSHVSHVSGDLRSADVRGRETRAQLRETRAQRVAESRGYSISSKAAHHGNVTQMDSAFGRLMKALDDGKLAKNTLVVFTSDNGPAITRRHPHGSAGPLRDKKGSLYEGGIRVPGIIRWPGRTKPGSESRQPISGVDLLPTLCELVGISVPGDRKIDGSSWLPMLAGKAIPRETPLYWQFNVSRSKPKVAMRIGDWKILATLTGPTIKPFGDIRPDDQKAIKSAELNTFELYNIRKDIGEKNDLAKQEPKRLRGMIAKLRTMYRDVRDESPTWPAWKWPRVEGKVIREFYKLEDALRKRGK